VIAAGAGGVLTRADYTALGVRQSIFPQDRRDQLYELFEKYRLWLAEARLFDLNLVAHEWQALAAPRYDFVVIDEVQDLTTAQLAPVLKTLKKPGHFLLCGDSNQIVHPNFFSWSQVKSLFWRDPQLAERQELRVLSANFAMGWRPPGSPTSCSRSSIGALARSTGKAIFWSRRSAAKPGRWR
jgi:hypothetical protein